MSSMPLVKRTYAGKCCYTDRTMRLCIISSKRINTGPYCHHANFFAKFYLKWTTFGLLLKVGIKINSTIQTYAIYFLDKILFYVDLKTHLSNSYFHYITLNKIIYSLNV